MEKKISTHYGRKENRYCQGNEDDGLAIFRVDSIYQTTRHNLEKIRGKDVQEVPIPPRDKKL